MLVRAASPEESLYIERAGVRVYTAEELCWCISKWPVLFLEDPASDEILRFLGEGTGRRRLSTELAAMKKTPGKEADIMARIPEAVGYMNQAELQKLRGELQRLKSLSPAAFMKEEADLMFSLRRYGRANAVYDRILASETDRIPLFLLGSILYNKGSALANLFFYEKASRCYEEAFSILKDMDILKEIYFLSRREPLIDVSERIRAAIPFEIPEAWEAEYEAAVGAAAEDRIVKDLDSLFAKDPIQRHAEAAGLISRWKTDYRGMSE